MKRIAPTLSLLALAGFAGAEVISDDAAKITVGLLTQARMDVNKGSLANNDTYSPTEGATGKQDTADFYLRRVRPALRGTFGNGFVFQTTLAADNAGKNGSNAVTVTLFDAFAGRKWTDGSISHTVVAGKKNAWFAMSNFTSATNLLPSMRPLTAVGVPNNVGAGYRLDAPYIRFGVDVLNNSGTGYNSTAAAPNGNGDDIASATQNSGEGLWYSGRLEITGAGDWASAWQESFAGRPGHGFVVGLEAGAVNNDRVTDADAVTTGTQAGKTSAFIYGLEAMLHLDGLTAVADVRGQKTTPTPDAGNAPDQVAGRTYSIQAGYALQSGIELLPVIEPAVRFAEVDNNTDTDGDSNATYGGADYSGSGRTIELGLNGYFNGHKNKLSADFIAWKGEEPRNATTGVASGDAPTAYIFRVQHQLWF